MNLKRNSIFVFLNKEQKTNLDEATSGLDTFTEAKIYETIRKLRKTVVIVSHRVNSLNFCDKIYHLSNGKVHQLKKSKKN